MNPENNSPKVTVLLPVYRGENTIKAAIDSILNQTFTDFELLIIDDAAVDGTVDVIKTYNDPRIRLVHNEKNMNLVFSLNKGIELAKGEYIARMDEDDICFPTRLEKQVQFLDKNPEVGICGAWIEIFGNPHGNGVRDYPSDHETIKASMAFFNPMAHPTVMMRRELLSKYNLRYERLLSEDYDLWERSSFHFELHNLPEVLLNYRVSTTSYSYTFSEKTVPVHISMVQARFKRLGLEISEEEAFIYRNGGWKIPLEDFHALEVYGRTLKLLLKANREKKLYDEKILEKLVIDVWRTACKNANIRKINKAIAFLTKMNGLLLLRKLSTYKYLYKTFF